MYILNIPLISRYFVHSSLHSLNFSLRVIRVTNNGIKCNKYKIHKIFTNFMKNINIYSNIFYIMKCNKASMNLIEYLILIKKKNPFGFFFFLITLHIYIKHVPHHVLHLITFRIYRLFYFFNCITHRN